MDFRTVFDGSHQKRQRDVSGTSFDIRVLRYLDLRTGSTVKIHLSVHDCYADTYDDYVRKGETAMVEQREMPQISLEEYTDKEVGIYIRMMQYSDTENIVKWRNTESVKRRFIYQKTFTKEGHENWIETMVKTGKVVQFIICDMDTDLPLGSVYIRDIDREHHKAEYGIFIGDENARGRGVGTAACKLCLKYCREKLELHRVFLRVFADNYPAIRSYEKAGFQREAYLKDDVCIDGKYADIVLMAVIFETYETERHGL